MQAVLKLFSSSSGEIQKFLYRFYGKNKGIIINEKDTQWQQDYPNPIELVDIIGAYIENIEDYNLTMWISIDSGVFIKVTTDNSDELIRYLFERFPY